VTIKRLRNFEKFYRQASTGAQPDIKVLNLCFIHTERQSKCDESIFNEKELFCQALMNTA
jgi:hypothetical protein